MRIIYVTANLPHGTDEAFIVPEIEQLMRSGNKVLVVPRSPGGKAIHGQKLLKYSRTEGLYSRPVLMTGSGVALTTPLRTVRAARPVFAGRSPSKFMKNLAVYPKALWLARLAVEWRAAHIHCHWAGTTATMAMLASRFSGIPWSLTAHRWDIVENNLLAEKARSAAFVRFISEDGLKMALARGVGPENDLRVIRMGVAVPGKLSQRPVPIRPRGGRPVVLCPARMVEVKGHRFLLEAWQILRGRGVDGELWLAGDGELRPQLEAMAKAFGLDGCVKFLGALPHQKLLRMYEEVPVCAAVLASIDMGNGDHEGIPVALIEAMSYGIPVVATAAGGTVELVLPGRGLLVPPAEPGALAGAIESLVQDAELADRLGRSGRQHVLDSYDIVRISTQLARAFEEAGKVDVHALTA